jgi:CheY-like chemotaxis protein
MRGRLDSLPAGFPRSSSSRWKPRRRMKLLIVDDHKMMRDLIRELAGSLASEVRECASGEEAVQECEHFQPDVVTMDLHMKKLNGLEATRSIRARHPSAFVVVVTHSGFAPMREAALRVGADHFVLKDDLNELRRCLQHPRPAS